MPLSPEQAIEVLKYQGYDPAKFDSVDAVKTDFDNEFARKSLLKDLKSDVHKEMFPIFIGRLAGTIQKDFLGSVKELGVELTSEEVKEKKIEDIIKLGLAKVKETYDGKITELQSKVEQGKDEAVKEWETKFEKLNKKYTDLDGLHKGLQTTYESEKGSWQSQVKQVKLDNILSKEHDKIKWKSGVKELEKTGFFAHLSSAYKKDIDDTGSFEVFDKEGKRIPNPVKSGTWKSYSEILEEEGKKFGVWEENPHGQPKQKPNYFTVGQQGGSPDGRMPAEPVRKISSKIKVA